MIYDQQLNKLILLQYGTNVGEGGIYRIDPSNGTWEFYGKPGGKNCGACGLFSAPTIPDAEVLSSIEWYEIDITIAEDESMVNSIIDFNMQYPSNNSTLCNIPTDETAVIVSAALVGDTLWYLTYLTQEDDIVY